MTPIAQSIGVNRIFTSQSIKYPLGFPDMQPEDEKAERTALLKEALSRLTRKCDSD
jgi:glycine reductase